MADLSVEDVAFAVTLAKGMVAEAMERDFMDHILYMDNQMRLAHGFPKKVALTAEEKAAARVHRIKLHIERHPV